MKISENGHSQSPNAQSTTMDGPSLDNAPDVWIVIPAFNEASVLADVVRNVRKSFPKVVVVDDHSTDNTGDLALDAGAFVIRHPINMGQGASLQTGIDFALRQGADVIVTFDADGQHVPADAVKMVERLIADNLDVVLGSRFKGAAEGISGKKKLLLTLATFYTRLTTGLDLSDTHNGLRAMSRQAAQLIRIRQNRMAHASEILHQISQLNLSFDETSCTIRYTDYSTRKGQRLSGALDILLDLYVRKLYK
jgi:glycosyltransferase involved in cell wall biosynthesis